MSSPAQVTPSERSTIRSLATLQESICIAEQSANRPDCPDAAKAILRLAIRRAERDLSERLSALQASKGL